MVVSSSLEISGSEAGTICETNSSLEDEDCLVRKWILFEISQFFVSVMAGRIPLAGTSFIYVQHSMVMKLVFFQNLLYV